MPGVSTSASKPLGHLVRLPEAKLFIVGPYTTPCGGCDAVQPFADILPRVVEADALGWHVLFEGALTSTTYGAIGKASEAYGNRFAFAFLDTPLALCIDRVNRRRAARGAEPLSNNRNIESKFASISRLRSKLVLGEGGVPQRRVEIIDHEQPLRALMRLYNITIRKEPA
jgi:hypothetical protein